MHCDRLLVLLINLLRLKLMVWTVTLNNKGKKALRTFSNYFEYFQITSI